GQNFRKYMRKLDDIVCWRIMPPRGRFRIWFIAEQNWYLCLHYSLKRPQSASKGTSQQLYWFAQQFHHSQILSHVPYNASKRKRIAVAAKNPTQICDPEHNANAIADHRKGACQARCYATSVANVSKEKSLLDVPTDGGNLRDLPPLPEVGVREHLRAWQEAQLLNQGLPIPSNVRQKLIVHTRDDELPMLLHDTADLDEGDEAIEDAEGDIGTQSLIRQGDVVEFG
ncbi:MAG: hypothetical protein Q9214_007324, partial [Letrouitia sp. 1 TL-2023]